MTQVRKAVPPDDGGQTRCQCSCQARGCNINSPAIDLRAKPAHTLNECSAEVSLGAQQGERIPSRGASHLRDRLDSRVAGYGQPWLPQPSIRAEPETRPRSFKRDTVAPILASPVVFVLDWAASSRRNRVAARSRSAAFSVIALFRVFVFGIGPLACRTAEHQPQPGVKLRCRTFRFR